MFKTIMAVGAVSSLALGQAMSAVTTFDFTDVVNNFTPNTPQQTTSGGGGFVFRVTETSPGGTSGNVFSQQTPAQIYIDNGGGNTNTTTATIQIFDGSDVAQIFSLEGVGQLIVQATTDLMVGKLGGATVWTIDSTNASDAATNGIPGNVDRIEWSVTEGAAFGHVIRNGITVDIVGPVPEPSTALLAGLAGFALLRRRRN